MCTRDKNALEVYSLCVPQMRIEMGPKTNHTLPSASFKLKWNPHEFMCFLMISILSTWEGGRGERRERRETRERREGKRRGMEGGKEGERRKREEGGEEMSIPSTFSGIRAC